MQDRPSAPRRNAVVVLLAVSLVAGLVTVVWVSRSLTMGLVATILVGMLAASGACLIAALVLFFML
ncbi:hypothetical protein DA075_24465 [Methylobacterium currus]|uniref:Uncharacterized protein n=1 Tax=Methylobacterium currus TaxID=2051553 RepID=A0A2R4WQ70_9HYPH|nr:hypothetical protein [Methylobacterium currus]AWB23655.1 hypothetical protein DA075_24465 [Methylobacterium currus]UHC16677.1 hypothetical protein LRS73_01725 [Methylobacterium currus]